MRIDDTGEVVNVRLNGVRARCEQVGENGVSMDLSIGLKIKRREQQASAKIKAAEAALVTELREKAATLAIASAAQIITSKLDDKAGLALVDDSATEIEKLN